jgi:antitoxin FitA
MRESIMGDMSVNITIRDVPDDVRNELAARAASSGRSLQEYLSRELAALAAKPSAAEAIMRARAHAARLAPVASTDLLSDLDADRR